MSSFNEEEYLQSVADELNANCENAKKPEIDDGYYNFTKYKWIPECLSIYFTNCRKYCYSENKHTCYEDWALCNSCETIIENKINKVFKKTKIELYLEIMELKKQVEDIKSILAKMNIC
jgi:hypothetical protein